MPEALTDRIILRDLQAFSKLGSYDFERILGQSIMIDLELELDLKKAGETNDVNDSIDYVEVSIAVRELCQSREFLLIENLATEIIKMLFNKFEKLEGVLIEIKKTIVNAEQFTGMPAIKIHRLRSEI